MRKLLLLIVWHFGLLAGDRLSASTLHPKQLFLVVTIGAPRVERWA
jgi:hypothetical protein